MDIKENNCVRLGGWSVRVECEQMCPYVIIIISRIIRKP